MSQKYQLMNKFSTTLVLTSLLVGLSGCSMFGTKSSDSGDGESSSSKGSASSTDGADSAADGANGKAATAKPGNGMSVAEVPADRKPEGGYKALGVAVRAGDARAVTTETSKILTANPNDAVALNALALMYVRRQKPGAAKLVLNRALEKNAGVAALYNNLGMVLFDEGETSAAIAQFKKALKVDAGHPEANGNLGAIYASGGDYVHARPLLEAAYKARPSNIAYANNYAVSLRVNKDLEGAKKIYEELLKTNARDLPTLLNYSILLIDFMNKPKEGLDVVYKIQFMEPEKEVLAKVNALEKKAKSEVK